MKPIFRSVALGFCLAFQTESLTAAECASPGNDGSGAIAGVVNTYWSGTSNPNVGTTSFNLGPASGASTPIAAGDLLMLIQMQDVNINRDNSGNYGDNSAGDPASGFTNARRAGRYEFVRATNAVTTAGGTLTISNGIVYDYTNSNANANRGARRFQIVRVPQYSDATISGTLTTSPWNGTTGGVVAIDVANTLTFAGGTVDVSGLGFRGGGGRNSTGGSGSNTDYRTPFTNGANGSKGEGIAGTPRLVFNGIGVTDTLIDGYPNGSFARGAPGNAGGGGTDGNPASNSQNTGGGGGAGFGPGGLGGHAWCGGGPSVCPQTGGFGGAGVSVQSVSRVTMGGGGGAGSTNNATGIPAGGIASSGAAGGGIIVIRAGTLTGSGTLSADGNSGNTTVQNDGSGGGGGGGTILISTDDATGASLTATARGGNGGSNGNSSPHGPGGGGGGGLVALTSNLTATTTNLTAGAPGVTQGNPAPFNANYGATGGTNGSAVTVNAVDVPGFSSGQECSVGIDKAFSPALAAANAPVRLTLTLTNPNPDLGMTALAVTDSYPANVLNAPTPNVANTCGGSVTATAGAASVALTGASLGAGASCAVEVDVVGTTGGDHVNTIPVGDAAADISGQAVSNSAPAQDTLTITLPLTANKTIAIISDPIHGTVEPYALPGAVAEYTISFSNPGTTTVDAGTIVITDAVPANTNFIAGAYAAGVSTTFDQGTPDSALRLNPGDVTFSNDGGTTFAYTPADGIDSTVTHIRISPSNAMAPGTSASVSFRVELD